MNTFDQIQLKQPRTSARTLVELIDRWLELPVMHLLGHFVMFAIAFTNLIDVEANNDTVSISGQALLKVGFLAIAGIYGLIGAFTDKRVQQHLFSLPLLGIQIVVALYFLAGLQSITPVSSIASAASIACVFLMTVTALVQLGIHDCLRNVFYATSLYVLGSWILFLLVPSIGVFHEPMSEGATFARMGGLAHPNTLGQISGFVILLGIALYKINPKFSLLGACAVLLAIGALVASLSRTSLLATVIAVVYFYQANLFQQKHIVAWSVATFVGLVTLMIGSMVFDLESLMASKLSLLSKSGDTSELTSATGRTEIWAYALKLIGERPLLGYGAATTKYYLKEYSFHCHNLILNVAFSCGVLGGLIMIWVYLSQAFQAIFRPHAISSFLMVFILLIGLFESAVFSILAGIATIVFIMGLVIPQLEDDPVNLKKETDIAKDGDYLTVNRNRLAELNGANGVWSLKR